MKKTQFVLLILAVSGLTTLSFAGGEYKILQKEKIGGEGGWDYLTSDVLSRRLYVSHATKVEVLDLDSLKAVGTIPDTAGVHGIALAPALGLGFISEGKADAVAIFDLKTLKKKNDVATGKNPDSLVFDPATARVFANNGRDNSSTVIDAKKGTVIATLALDGKPEFAVADGNGHVFVNLEDKNSLVRIDSRDLKVEKTWALAGCDEPSSLALDQVHQRLFVGCGNKVMAVVDSETGNVITTLPIGDHVDATVFDAEAARVFNSNGDGTLTVIQEDAPDKYHVVENVVTQRGARTLALDSKTHRLFLPTAEFGPAPEATTEHPHPRPPIVPGTFTLLVVGRS